MKLKSSTLPVIEKSERGFPSEHQEIYVTIGDG